MPALCGNGEGDGGEGDDATRFKIERAMVGWADELMGASNMIEAIDEVVLGAIDVARVAGFASKEVVWMNCDKAFHGVRTESIGSEESVGSMGCIRVGCGSGCGKCRPIRSW